MVEDNDYEENGYITLVDEDGVPAQYEHLLTFEYKGEWYMALTLVLPAEETDEEDDGGEEIAIYHCVSEGNEVDLKIIEDEDLLDEVFAEFCNQYEDFEDADEAEELDGPFYEE